jgi:uridine phosphorylase
MAITLDGTTGISTPPIILNSTALGTAVAGEFEYDGGELYFTPLGTQRGLVPSAQYYRLNTAVVGANATGAQNVLGVGVTLSSNTFYEFEGVFNFFKVAGTTSHTFSFGWGGTSTFNSITTNIFVVNSINGFVTLAGKTLSYLTPESATQTVLTGAISSAFHTVNLQIRGIVGVNAGGTFIPQYSLSAAPGGAYTSSVNNYMKIYPIGAAGSNTSVGTWA